MRLSIQMAMLCKRNCKTWLTRVLFRSQMTSRIRRRILLEKIINYSSIKNKNNKRKLIMTNKIIMVLTGKPIKTNRIYSNSHQIDLTRVRRTFRERIKLHQQLRKTDMISRWAHLLVRSPLFSKILTKVRKIILKILSTLMKKFQLKSQPKML
jgi:hypothetical protein